MAADATPQPVYQPVSIDDRLLEELLNEDEGTTLDFKRDQYLFVGASDGEKAELLKDVVAFANAWRRSTAFILIGVDEVKGGRSRIVGVNQQLNDADIQQFVNAKTNAPIAFSCYVYPFEGVQLGVIEIPRQARPFFLTKNFGGLSRDVVYLRRGSSTDVADPAEIARMGAAEVAAGAGRPSFELEWANTYTQQRLGCTAQLRSTVLVPRLKPETFDRRQALGGVTIFTSTVMGFDPDYYRDLIHYTYDAAFLSPVGLVIRNVGDVVAENVLVKCRIEKVDGVRIGDFKGRPVEPSRYRALAPAMPMVRNALLREPDPRVAEYPTHWEVSVDIQRIAPKATVWTTDVLWVGSERSATVGFPFDVYSDNLAAPVRADLSLEVVAEGRAMVLADCPQVSH